MGNKKRSLTNQTSAREGVEKCSTQVIWAHGNSPTLSQHGSSGSDRGGSMVDFATLSAVGDALGSEVVKSFSTTISVKAK